MRIYTCNYCMDGKHENCEREHRAPKGHFGGSRCICGCNGRSLKKWREDNIKEAKKRIIELAKREKTRASLNTKEGSIQLD